MTATLPLPTVKTPATSLEGKRWLHVVSHTDPRYGGLSSAVPALGVTLRERYGIDVRLAAFCNAKEQHRPAGYDDAHLSFWPASRRAWSIGSAGGDLRAALREEISQVDGVHIHGLWEKSTAVACAFARSLGKPYVLSAHGMLEPWALAHKRLKKRVYGALVEKRNVADAACLHALTAAEAEQYRRFGAKGKVAVVPNAVDPSDDASAEMFLRRYPELRNKRIVLFLSRLHPKKGLDLLVEAWARVGKAHPEARLVLAGPDSEGMQAKLTCALVERGMDDQTVFTGMLAGALKWSALDAAECFVLPSYSEGLSMALLEAMGMGLPAIATHACNMPELTASNAGWEIAPAVDPLATALSEMLGRSSDENWATGQNGARLIGAHFGVDTVARQMAEVYAQVLGVSLPEAQESAVRGER